MRPRSGSHSADRPRLRLLAAVAAVALVASACPGTSDDERARPTASPPRARTGGEIVVAYPQEPHTLDPFAATGDAVPVRDLVRLVMPGLERVGPGGERRLWLLAEEPRLDPGPPFTVHVRLRDDAVWSDGTPVTVDDLRFTWRTAIARPDAGARDGYDRIDAIVAEDPRRARIVFSEPFARWRDLFSAGLGVLPAHALGDERRLRALGRRWRVSGGPFVLKRWRRGLDMTFARTPHPFTGNDPSIDRLRVVFVPDVLGALTLLERGEVHALAGYHAPDFARHAGAVRDVTVTSDAGSTWVGLLLNTDATPLRDRAVRRALADSIDRGRVVRGLVRGEGTPIETASPAPGRTEGAFDRYGDLARARRTLSRAGWTGRETRRKAGAGLSFTIALPSTDDLSGVVARAVQFQALRAGFDAQPLPLEPDTFWREWLPGRRFTAAVVVWRDPPGGAVRARFGLTPNRARLDDARLRRALRAADRGTAEASVAERRLAALVPVIPLYAATVSIAARGSVTGARPCASADGPFCLAHEWQRR